MTPRNGGPTKPNHHQAERDDFNILQTNYKNFSKCQKETIADKENIFTVEGLLTAIIEDIAMIKAEHRSTQKSVVSLIPITRQIVREELARLRGYA